MVKEHGYWQKPSNWSLFQAHRKYKLKQLRYIQRWHNKYNLCQVLKNVLTCQKKKIHKNIKKETNTNREHYAWYYMYLKKRDTCTGTKEN